MEGWQLVHGDLKISNLIFDAAGKAVGIIDFDTLLVHARAIDLGDALRSWCNWTAEDDRAAGLLHPRPEIIGQDCSHRTHRREVLPARRRDHR